jgi:hypothetical protein
MTVLARDTRSGYVRLVMSLLERTAPTSSADIAHRRRGHAVVHTVILRPYAADRFPDQETHRSNRLVK